jgi:hypothetical protein
VSRDEPASPCDHCAGNGEIVTDWNRYLEPLPGDSGDEAVADCPRCDGVGRIPHPTPDQEPHDP